MGYGYSLLPTVEQPTSTMTFRLTPEEKVERDIWILGAAAREMPLSEIAFEVGLSEQRVKQIIKSKTPTSIRKKKKFTTPREAALYEFEEERMHPECRRVARGQLHDMMCNDCFGMSMIIESEYDANGWPYSWAMYGQEKYIEACA